MFLSKFKKALIILLVCFSSSIVSAQDDDEDIELRSNVHLLMDLSTSYFGKGTEKENTKALIESFKVIRNIIKSEIDKPVIVQVMGITELSQQEKIICEAVLNKKRMFKRKSDDNSIFFKKPKKLYKFLKDVCLPNILTQEPRPGTDISGALEKSTRVARSQVPDGDNILIVHSDFFEFRATVNGKVLELPIINLKGFRVLLVYRAELVSKYDNTIVQVDDAVKGWRKSMKSMGAKQVVIVSDESKFASFATDELF